jgi:AraC-like DNA-binding protein/quercetin dioxygenase-like cupin family protein
MRQVASKMRQKHDRRFFSKRAHGAAVTTLSYEYAPNEEVSEHFHDSDQLVYAVSGVMTLRTADGMWVVPPLRALWVPGGTLHAIRMSGTVAMKTLYITPRLAKLPRTCCVLQICPFLRELVLLICEGGILRRSVPKQARLLGVLLDQLKTTRSAPLELPMPRDPRALRIATAVVRDPSDGRPLRTICQSAGGSKRTVERVFLQETQMTFGAWRRQASLLHAVGLLARGEKVTTVALGSGYTSVSAFIAMFRQALGKTPGEYFLGF